MNLHEAVIAVLSYALQSGLLLTVGLILPTLLRLGHPRTLLIYWRILLLVVLLLPLIPLDWAGRAAFPYLTLDGLHVEAAVNTALPSHLPDLSWKTVMLVIAAVSMLGMARLAIGLEFLSRCRRRAQPLSPTPTSVADLQTRLGLEVPFLVSARLTTPLTFGCFRPAVLLPVSFRNLTADQQEGIACHELLHVLRGDWPMTLIEELLRAVVWFHPAVWLILPRIALSREQVVDAETVRLTGKRRPYLDALWQVICTARRSATAPAVSFLDRRDIVERVAWLKKEIPMSRKRIALNVLMLLTSTIAAGFVGATAFSNDSPRDGSMWRMQSTESKKNEERKEPEETIQLTSADELCDEITAPIVVEKINPEYPPEARQERVMGQVVVRTIITDQGLVDDIQILESDDERFSQASIEAIEQWRFEPALCDGTPVSVYYNLTVNFSLE